MKLFFILLITFSVAYAAISEQEKRFLLSTITDAINSVTNTVNNVIETTQNVISTSQIVGQILWDNAFGPALDLFLNLGADFVDNYFGEAINTVGNVVDSVVGVIGKKRNLNLEEKRFLLSTITDAINSVTNTVNNVIETTQNVISTSQIVGQILWDNAFGPALDLFLNLGADFVDNYFGEAINTVGNVVGSVVGVFFGAYYFKDALNDLLDQVGPVFTDFGNSAISLFTSNLLSIVANPSSINGLFTIIFEKLIPYLVQLVEIAINLLFNAINTVNSPELGYVVASFQFELLTSGVLLDELQDTYYLANTTVNWFLDFFNGGIFDPVIEYFNAQISAFLSEILSSVILTAIFVILTGGNLNTILASIFSKLGVYIYRIAEFTINYTLDIADNIFLQFYPVIDRWFKFFATLSLPYTEIPILNTIYDFFDAAIATSSLNLDQFDITLDFLDPIIQSIVNFG